MQPLIFLPFLPCIKVFLIFKFWSSYENLHPHFRNSNSDLENHILHYKYLYLIMTTLRLESRNFGKVRFSYSGLFWNTFLYFLLNFLISSCEGKTYQCNKGFHVCFKSDFCFVLSLAFKERHLSINYFYLISRHCFGSKWSQYSRLGSSTMVHEKWGNTANTMQSFRWNWPKNCQRFVHISLQILHT